MLGLSISSLATNLKVQYEQRRFYIEEDEESIWQLFYPKHFVNISLHHVKLFQNLKTSSVSDVSFDFDKFLSEILVGTSPQHQNRVGMQRSSMILINGAPGMGKTTLCKEIAYRWAKGNELLKHIDLVFLLFLCDPDLKKVHTIDQLIQYVESSAFETAQHYTKLLSSYKNVVIIMDGFDEFSDTSGNSLVTYIIKRKVLSHCKIIITSRPCASESLQNHADVAVEIRGFNEQSKKEYINNELSGDPERIRRVQLCLQRYSDINSVCCIPIIMFGLVFIIKRSGELPEDQMQLYNHFISFVISRSQQRLENSFAEVLLINELPQIYHDNLLQLCRFAYEHIRNDSVIFTEEDVNKVCTSFNLSASKFYGLGLLHYTRYTEFINNKVAERVYCNFVHHSIQEYLAAYYISSLESCNQFLLLRNTFFVNNYLGTWIMFAKMNKDKMFDCQQMLVYSCMQNFPIETKSSLLLFIDNIFQNGQFKNFTICANVEVLCFQVGSQCVSENLSISDHFIAYLSLCNIRRNTGHLHIYLICNGVQNKSYEKMTEKLLLSDHDIATMILENDVLIGYRIIEQQLNDGLGINKLLGCIMLVDCHITINMTNKISSYVKEYNGVQEIFISNCLIDSLQLNISSLTHLVLKSINFSTVMIDELADLIKRNRFLEFISMPNNNLQSFAFILLQALKTLVYIESLDLNNNNMGEAATEHIADVIYNNCDSFLTELHLAGNDLKSTAVVVLQALKKTTTLELLDLNNNGMTSMVAEDLAGVIRCNSFLAKLHLANNDLKSSAVAVLRALQGVSTLEVLDLSFNNMTSIVAEDLACVIKCNTCLAELRLADNDLKTAAVVVLQALQRITTVKLLDLSYNNMTSVVADDLAYVIISNSCLEKLYLAGNDLKSSGVVMFQALQGITTLKILDLNFNYMTSFVTEDLASVIKCNSSLEELHLSCNYLESRAVAVLQALQGITTLKLLDLNSNNMTSVIAEDLADVIKRNPCLEELHLAYNDLNSSAIVVLQALQEIRTLKLLNLSVNNMTSVVAEDLASVIKRNLSLKKLNLANNDLNSSAGVVLQALQEITTLELLNLSKNNLSNVVAEDLASVITCSSCLKELHLADNDLKSTAVLVLQALKETTTLELLDLNDNSMTGVVAEDLADVINCNSCLEELHLANNDLKSSAVAVLQALQGIATLKVLDLSFNNMTGVVAEDLAYVINRNSCLEYLYLSNNDLKSTAVVVLQALQGITTLKVLNLSCNDMTSVVAEDLACVIKCNSCLAELHLASNNLETTAVVVLQALQGITTLELLDLSFNHLTRVVAEDLASVIKSNSCLKKLYLSGNDLKSSGVVMLQALQGITTLKVLDLSFNHMTSVAAKELVDIIKRNPCLEELHLAYNGLNSFTILVLRALQEVRTLKLLDLRGNNMTSVVAQDLVGVIEQNPCLEELHLGYNDLNSSAIEVLQALQEITTLKLLDLSCNNMTSVVAQDLAGVIKCNPSLKKLHLANNDLKSSASVVLQALQEITTVELLDLSQNSLSSVVAEDLAIFIECSSCLMELHLADNDLKSTAVLVLQALKETTTLKLLDLNDNGMTCVVAEDLAEVINCNSCLEELHLANNDLKSSAVAVLQALQGIATLKVLDLSFNNMTGVVAEDLAYVINRNSCLEYLYLSNNDLKSTAVVVLQALQGITTLKVLNLSCNDMTSVVAEDLACVIKCNSCLAELHLASNNLETTAVVVLQALQGITTLELLDLNFNHLTGVVAEDLACVIKSNSCLKKLYLSGNDLKSSGVVMLQALQGITALKVLDLNRNHMTSVIAKELVDVIKRNPYLEELYLAYNDLNSSTIVVLQALQEIRTLKLLDLNGNNMTSVVAQDLVGVIEQNPCLEKLHLAGNDLNSSTIVVLQALQEITTLELLNLRGNNMTSVVAHDLAGVIEQNPCLEELYLGYNDLNSSAIVVFEALQEITTLKLLDLSCNNMTSVVAEDLASVIECSSCLMELHLADNDLKSTAVLLLQALKETTTLKLLDLNNNDMTGVVAEDLADVINCNSCLEELHLANNDLKSSAVAVLQALQGITTLKILNLSFNNMTGVVAEDLAYVINRNSCLEYLYLSNNDLKSTAVVVLQALQGITTLKVLNLSCNDMTSVVAEDLACVIKCNSCLAELHLASNNLETTAVVVLQALQGITTLELLDLNFNHLTGVVAEDLACVIKSNSCLKKLYLSGNDLKSSGVVMLQALQGITTLKVLDLSFNNMTSVIAKELVDVIKRNACLEELHLAYNDLNLSTIVVLQALQEVRTLKLLDLRGSNMTSVVAQDLVGVIEQNPCLEKLHLGYNDLNSSAIEVFQALQEITTLKLLDLSCNNMTSVVAQDLAGVINCNSCLEQLHLANNDLKSSAVAVLQALQGIATLKVLDLSFNNMTGVVAEDLAYVINRNSCLEKLYLSGNDLKSTAVVVLQALQGITTLEVLNLSCNDMTSVVAEDLALVIKCNSCLAELHLASNNLEATAVVVLQALQGITTLELLDLNFNHLTGVVAEDLACVIKSNSCLKKLYLSGNDLKSSGVVMLQALQGITTLKVLDLSFNNMTSVIAKELVDVIKRNACLEELHLACNDLNSSTIVVLQALQEITTLKLLDLSYNNITSVVAQDLVGVIEQNPCLEELHLGYNDLNSCAIAVLQALQEITTLALLDLSRNNMTSVVAQDLADVIEQNPCLEELHLGYNDLNSSAIEVLQALQEITTLKLLDLSCNNMTSVVAQDLAGVINCNSCLEQLHLANNDLKSSAVAVLQALQGIATLKVLDLNFNNMTGVVAEDLAYVIDRNSCLEYLYLSNNDLKSTAVVVLQALQGITTLEVLNLSCNNMTSVVAEDLACVIKSNSCLKKLYLYGNDLKSSGVVMLQALQGITTLKVLDLSFNNMTSVIAKELVDVIKRNPCLEELHLAYNDLNSSTIVVLQALQEVRTLKLLDLRGNNMTSVVAQDLVGVIEQNPCLEKLHLAGNDLNSSAVVVLQALQEITALKLLNLRSNNMTSVVAQDLVGVIEQNPCLEELHLGYNDLNSSAIEVLQALQEITTLKLLDLSCNNMTSVVAQDLAGVIKCNPSLKKLHLANNGLKSSAGVVLQALQEITTVELLNLSQNSLSSVIAEDLASVIECSSCLMELRLADNDLKSTAVLVLQALKETTTLRLLDLNNNGMTGVVAEDLADVINCNSCLEELHLANNDLKSSAVAVLQASQGIATLEVLDLSFNNMTGVVAEDLAYVINRNSCLEKLYLSNNDLKSTAVVVLQALQGITTLEVLDLSCNDMTSVVAEDLALVIKCNSCLAELHLASNNLGAAAVVVLQALQGITTLELLDLNFNHLTGVAAEYLACVIKSNSCLKKLYLSGNDLKSSGVVMLQALQGITTLKVLDLSFNHMTSVIAKELVDVIKCNPCLEELHLAYNDLNSSTIMVLQALQKIRTLKLLDLSGNNMTSVVAQDLAGVIEQNPCLQELHLDYNDLNSFTMVVLRALQEIRTLKLLDLSGNSMMSVVAQDLADVIEQNPCLEELHLAGNDLNSSAIVVLRALQEIRTLKLLNLSSNNMTSVVAQDLADVIEQNPCLEELHLADNDLNSSAIVVLQALQEITTLKLLDLSCNNMTSVVAQDLAGVIEQNPCLEELHLAVNDLSSSAIVILQALQAITTLKLLDLSFNNLTNVVVEDLAGVIKCNPCLEKLDIANNELNSSAIMVIQTLHEIATLNLLDLSFNNMTSDDLAKCNLCLELYLANKTN